MKILVAVLVVVPFCFGMAFAHEQRSGLETLSEEEIKTFVPLVCEVAEKTDGQTDSVRWSCKDFVGYPQEMKYWRWDSKNPELRERPLEFVPISIFYGSLTRRKADQAYMTYLSSVEPGAMNFGGGILFENTGGKWKLIRWYPGYRMDGCIALPLEDRGRKRLCREERELQGGTKRVHIQIQRVPRAFDSKRTFSPLKTDKPIIIMKAQDWRGASGDDSLRECLPERKKRPKFILLDIGTPRASPSREYVAESTITYATQDDIANACRVRRFGDMPVQQAVVRYLFKSGRIKVESPIELSEP